MLVLALGIGFNSAIFSLVQELTMRPAPGVRADDALVRIRGITLARAEARRKSRGFSGPELNAIAARRETFVSVAGFASEELLLDLGDGNEPRLTRSHLVTPNYFATLAIAPAIGPGLPAGGTADTPGAELAVMIAHSLWEELGADTAMIGRVVRVNDVPMRVAGSRRRTSTACSTVPIAGCRCGFHSRRARRSSGAQRKRS